MEAKGGIKKIHGMILMLEDGLLALLVGAMIAIASTQIVLRNFFDASISWGDPTLRILVLWTALLGAMSATRNNNHIRIDILSRFLPDKINRLTRRLTNLFAAVVCALVAWHSARFVRFEWEDGSILFASIPAWAAEAIIPIGFGVMALRFLLHTILGEAAEEPAP
jgi:TRAP-type C4-dicarboxylate transport system permease small subunit